MVEERRRFGEFLLETFATRRESWRSDGEDESKKEGLKIRDTYNGRYGRSKTRRTAKEV